MFFRSVHAGELPPHGFDEQIPKAIKSQRSTRLHHLQAELRRDYFRTLIGQNLQLLIERIESPKRGQGTACRYAPVVLDFDDSSIAESATLENDAIGRLMNVVAIDADEKEIVARPA